VEFNDGSVHPSPNPVITKDAYVLFFRRVSDAPRTLESLRAMDDRCRGDSSWVAPDTLSTDAVQMWNHDMPLDNLGFDPALTRRALMRAKGDDNRAANLLLDAAVNE
jgi:hypothetical protein